MLSILITILLCTLLGLSLNKSIWWLNYEYKNKGFMRAKTIRLWNHDVLVNKIKNVQQVSIERARNKDPDRGASGMLRLYLLFICGYVFHKTLNRCYTRFTQDINSIILPNIVARTKHWRTASLTILLITILTIIFNLFYEGRVFLSLVLFQINVLLIPILGAYLVQDYLHNSAVKKGSYVSNHFEFLHGLYVTHIPKSMLQAFDETDNQSDRFDFPDIYKYNDVEDYAKWLHSVLTSLKRHEDETRA
jgi:hypothetical protein